MIAAWEDVEVDWDQPVTPVLPEWKVDESPDRGPCIYAVGVPRIRLVATCVDRAEADLIVSLYEEKRKAN